MFGNNSRRKLDFAILVKTKYIGKTDKPKTKDARENNTTADRKQPQLTEEQWSRQRHHSKPNTPQETRESNTTWFLHTHADTCARWVMVPQTFPKIVCFVSLATQGVSLGRDKIKNATSNPNTNTFSVMSSAKTLRRDFLSSNA